MLDGDQMGGVDKRDALLFVKLRNDCQDMVGPMLSEPSPGTFRGCYFPVTSFSLPFQLRTNLQHYNGIKHSEPGKRRLPVVFIWHDAEAAQPCLLCFVWGRRRTCSEITNLRSTKFIKQDMDRERD